MRSLFTVIFALIISSVNAQELSVDFLSPVEFANEPQSENYSLTTDSTHYFFTHFYDKNRMRSRCFMSSRSLSDNTISSSEIEFPQGFASEPNNAQDLHGTVALNGQIYALVSTIRTEDDIRQLYAHSVSQQVEMEQEGKLVLEFPIKGFIRSGRISSANSPNGQYLAVLGIHPFKEKKMDWASSLYTTPNSIPSGKSPSILGILVGQNSLFTFLIRRGCT
jgi:hypothetical protein